VQGIFFNDFKTSYIPQILEEVYIKQVYLQYVVGKRDLIIADWGANIGLTSFYFKDFAKQIYAVEPAKAHGEIITQMVTFNKIKNIKLCPYAISNENGKVKFYHPENVTMYSMENVMGATEFEEVETVDAETFFKREGITHLDILKLDVEGSESKILTSKGFASVAPKIKVILGEHHSWDAQGKDGFTATLRDLGYEVKWNTNTDASTYSAVRV
jgi:FkbM family methyltransferase